MDTTKKQIRKITGLAILIALTIILQFLAGFIKIGPVEINLGLIPIIFAAFLYGPIEGMLVGIVNGMLVLVNPGTDAFLGLNVVATIITCITKTGLAGLVSGFIYKAFKKHHEFIGSVVASVVVPIINTSIFFICCLIFFLPLFGESTEQALTIIASTIFAINTLIEIISISILSPAIYRVLLIVKKRIFKEEQ